MMFWKCSQEREGFQRQRLSGKALKYSSRIFPSKRTLLWGLLALEVPEKATFRISTTITLQSKPSITYKAGRSQSKLGANLSGRLLREGSPPLRREEKRVRENVKFLRTSFLGGEGFLRPPISPARFRRGAQKRLSFLSLDSSPLRIAFQSRSHPLHRK